jgi:hypothetical protein
MLFLGGAAVVVLLVGASGRAVPYVPVLQSVVLFSAVHVSISICCPCSLSNITLSLASPDGPHRAITVKNNVSLLFCFLMPVTHMGFVQSICIRVAMVVQSIRLPPIHHC